MQTSFTPEQRADPALAESEAILRRCVHCGFCTATCPTYVTLGNELDSPRGRIYLIKDMLENGRPATEEVVTHLDRCLSCLACTTTCPSGVDYMHLIDHARVHVEQTYPRPLADRLIRGLLAAVLPYPARFRAALRLARLARPLGPALARVAALKPLAAMLRLAQEARPAPPASSAPVQAARPVEGAASIAASTSGEGLSGRRVALLAGCAQSVLDPSINEAAARLLSRFGVEVVDVPGEGCCGALVHHMGRQEEALAFARRNVDAWTARIEAGGLDAILVTTSGCGTTLKDYGHMLQHDPAYAQKAARISALALDITEYLDRLDLPACPSKGLTVAYHAACSLQHGQKVTLQPKRLLSAAGFTLREPAEGHLCCGSAGTYNILQPEISATLQARKVGHLEATRADLVAAGNIGCITQIGQASRLPVVHTVELLDWAYGGPVPARLAEAELFAVRAETTGGSAKAAAIGA
ncbi:2-hydroxy-acid oxidase [Xaviernesmea oryzae]|uniref:Glycolate oxidase iron-sulfur subunit n=1 Tax=Xaviernesmea oryzae TaxID=464029 RepID=A0A1Q9B3F4_9HYPH|nr:heterodisulfide reductase-related iron-sulfur binding cluster [Xaviernesmea oryzae]OLP62572.1 2-hydroxy-acid oxidase [Xaviernesmea oryzae]SEM19022.1 glycolate oxidase iron-sulfur subunit [Xaviernesmea oryzae]